MKCPKCVKEGKRSKVYGGMGMKTLLYCQPWYDEDGKYHDHDSNTTTTSYSCSNNHAWREMSSGSCWCGWGSVPRIEMLDDLIPPKIVEGELGTFIIDKDDDRTINFD